MMVSLFGGVLKILSFSKVEAQTNILFPNLIDYTTVYCDAP